MDIKILRNFKSNGLIFSSRPYPTVSETFISDSVTAIFYIEYPIVSVTVTELPNIPDLIEIYGLRVKLN